MSTSGRPDESSQMESMKNGQKVSKDSCLLINMAQNVHFWSPCSRNTTLWIIWWQLRVSIPIWRRVSIGLLGISITIVSRICVLIRYLQSSTSSMLKIGLLLLLLRRHIWIHLFTFASPLVGILRSFVSNFLLRCFSFLCPGCEFSSRRWKWWF